MAAPVFRLTRFLVSQAKSSICRACQNAVWNAGTAVRWNSNRAVIAKTNRKVYTRQYPVLVVNPDGSTFRIKYKEPQKIIKLPLDINSLTFDERKKRLSRYQVRKKRVIKDDLGDDADVTSKYRHLWKKT
ncbi:39S ribosomal protein L55, mitochondrial-like [Patiria miniata]|uniref:Mitochondrial ribosomal protein L55 n=1 Tax=Patiria miniata TaxID=46514 RepID=A0A914B171_PATMI|nr:39S ribosomal protein L55, mitochondrial-like [Patiria miniata]